MNELKKKNESNIYCLCKYLLQLTFLLLLLISAVSCEIKIGGKKKKKNDNTEAVSSPVVICPSWIGDISRFLRLDGVLEADRDVAIFSKSIGRVVKLSIEEGSEVSAGQVLAQLENDEQALALQRAKNTLETDRASLKRAEKLYTKQGVSTDDIDKLRSIVKDDELRVQQAELALSQTNITAPFSGVISERYISLGDRIDISRPLFKLVDNKILHVDTWVSTNDASKLKVGQFVSLFEKSYSEKRYQASLVRISPVVDPGFNKIKATFELSNINRELKPGQFIELELTLETHHDVQQIPRKALVYEAGIPIVFQSVDSLALKKKVELGLEAGDIVEIIKGISPGDSIIVEGQATLRDSAKIMIVNPTR
ncbi:efflux RND transporter periplasmic adaptor subunit [bacterium]|nr:efflux RND transporter periplasmic adaptor subunit [bacterium]